MVRDAVPEDEPCLVAMWLKGYANTQVHKMPDASSPGSKGQVRFWRLYRPIVLALLRSCRVRVLCDAERVDYRPDKPAIIWAWSCTDGSLVHWVAIKRRLAHADSDLARDAFEALFSEEDRTSTRRTSFYMPDLYRYHLVPSDWHQDPSYLGALVALSDRLRMKDAARFADVAQATIAASREAWGPDEVRGEEAA